MAAAWRISCSSQTLNLCRLRLKPRLISKCIWKVSFCSNANPYIFHPKTKTLEGKDQALYLTKSIVNGELPPRLQNNSIDDDLKQELMDNYRQSIIQTRLFNYEGEESTKTTCALPLMINMLKGFWSQSASFAGLHEKAFTYKPRVSAVWKRHDDVVQVSGGIGFLISSKHALPNWVSHTEVQETKHQNLNSLDLISPIFDLQQVASKGDVDTGFYPGSPYPNTHTLVIVNTEKQFSVEDRCAQGLLFTFARLLTQATILNGEKMGEVLEQPLSAQCVVSDGFRLSFISFQLNTLEFATDEGIKNIAWVLPGVQMYKKASFSEEDSKPIVEDFNEDCFEILSRMMINGLV